MSELLTGPDTVSCVMLYLLSPMALASPPATSRVYVSAAALRQPKHTAKAVIMDVVFFIYGYVFSILTI